jgi:hypothetical protein
MMAFIDWRNLADDELAQVALGAAAEFQRRQTIADGPANVDRICRAFAAGTLSVDPCTIDASAGCEGRPEWRELGTGWPSGARVAHDGHCWVAVSPATQGEPGVSPMWIQEDSNQGGAS